MEKLYTVLLSDQTAGTVESDTQIFEDDTVTITYHDENGMTQEKTGKVFHIFGENNPWE